MLIIERDCRYGIPSGNDLPTVEGITPFLASLLYARGATDSRQMNEFLNPSLDQLHDPMLLPDIEKAVERIESAYLAIMTRMESVQPPSWQGI